MHFCFQDKNSARGRAENVRGEKRNQTTAEADALAAPVFFEMLLFFVAHHTIASTTAAAHAEGRHHIRACGIRREGGRAPGRGEHAQGPRAASRGRCPNTDHYRWRKDYLDI